MLTPTGESGDRTDKTMLLAMWADFITKKLDSNEAKPFIAAGMGKPTYPLSQFAIEIQLAYWQRMKMLVANALSAPENITGDAALDYGNPSGDEEPRKIMAEAMTQWYDTPIAEENILFTVGGAGALRSIFETFNLLYEDLPGYRVITPFPHYTLYADNTHVLHPVDVMKEPGYRLTARALEDSIKEAYKLAEKDGKYPKVFLLSNPSNPLGTVISAAEMKELAEVLIRYPDLHVVWDGAYEEMVWSGTDSDTLSKPPSLIQIAPELKPRTLMLRSGTKAHSAAGERMAVLMAFDPGIMIRLVSKHISMVGHAPRSTQLAYAKTMKHFTTEDQKNLYNFYYPKVDYVYQRVKNMGATMPDPAYKVAATFYVLADFSDILGMDIPDAAKQALGHTGKISNSEELVYSLLFNDHITFGPGMYYGMGLDNGYLRITCSETKEKLCELMDRAERALLHARQSKGQLLLAEVTTQIKKLAVDDADKAQCMQKNLDSIIQHDGGCMALKIQNSALTELLETIKQVVAPVDRSRSALVQGSFLSKTSRNTAQDVTELDDEWQIFVDDIATAGPLKNYLLALPRNERHTCKPWVEHLSVKANQKNAL